jgi:type II secretory pathway component PulF
MKLDEFAFVNQQLAAMLRNGIPLEGALRQLSATMARGGLRAELQQLETDLAKGAPLGESLASRKLPPLYAQMIQVGVRSNDLPGMLTMLADYYQRSHTTWTRLKGLMVYPLIVLVTSLGVSVFLWTLFTTLSRMLTLTMGDVMEGAVLPALTGFSMRIAPVGFFGPMAVLAVLTLIVGTLLAIPRLRRWLCWRLPVWRDASVWRSAAVMEVLLRGGCPLAEALELLRQLEAGSPAGADLARWRERLAAGHGQFVEMAKDSRAYPPLFVWLVSNAGEDLATGFKRAAELYQARAAWRAEMLLQAVLPVSVLVLGVLIFTQVFTMIVYVLGQYLPFLTGFQIL